MTIQNCYNSSKGIGSPPGWADGGGADKGAKVLQFLYTSAFSTDTQSKFAPVVVLDGVLVPLHLAHHT